MGFWVMVLALVKKRFLFMFKILKVGENKNFGGQNHAQKCMAAGKPTHLSNGYYDISNDKM